MSQYAFDPTPACIYSVNFACTVIVGTPRTLDLLSLNPKQRRTAYCPLLVIKRKTIGNCVTKTYYMLINNWFCSVWLT